MEMSLSIIFWVTSFSIVITLTGDGFYNDFYKTNMKIYIFAIVIMFTFIDHLKKNKQLHVFHNRVYLPSFSNSKIQCVIGVQRSIIKFPTHPFQLIARSNFQLIHSSYATLIALLHV